MGEEDDAERGESQQAGGPGAHGFASALLLIALRGRGEKEKSPLRWTRDLLKGQMRITAPLRERGGREGCGLVRRVARFDACQTGSHPHSHK